MYRYQCGTHAHHSRPTDSAYTPRFPYRPPYRPPNNISYTTGTSGPNRPGTGYTRPPPGPYRPPPRPIRPATGSSPAPGPYRTGRANHGHPYTRSGLRMVTSCAVRPPPTGSTRTSSDTSAPSQPSGTRRPSPVTSSKAGTSSVRSSCQICSYSQKHPETKKTRLICFNVKTNFFTSR